MRRKKTTIETWIDEYYDIILGISVRMLENRDDAKDCTQEVFIKAYKNFRQYKGEAHPVAWLKKIALNTCYNFLERNKTRKWDEVQDDQVRQEANDASSNNFDKRYLKRLSHMERGVLVARVYEDMTFKDAALSMKTTEASARVAYHNAVKKLKGLMI